MYWECVLTRRGSCTARATTQGQGDQLKLVSGPEQSPHTHPGNVDAVQAEVVRSSLKRKAIEDPECPTKIIRGGLAQLPAPVLSQLPLRENLKRAIRRKREVPLPANPVTLRELQKLNGKYVNTLNGEEFLQYDSRNDGKFTGNGRVLVFCFQRNLELIAQSETWFIDGAPRLFTQLFTILGTVVQSHRRDDSKIIALPFVYGLLSSKEEAQYEVVYGAVAAAATKYGIRNCQPARVMSDFETAILKATRTVFPSAIITGYYFHLGKTLYHRIQSEGLQEQYVKQGDEICMQTHRLLALAFVPPPDVVDAFDKTYGEVTVQKMLLVYNYFDINYIRGVTVRGRRRAVSPRFPIVLWNQYEATLNGFHRTNNVSEGWYNRFNLLAGKAHPSFYTFLDLVQKEQGDIEGMLAEVGLGRSVRAPQQRKTIALQERLQCVLQSYEGSKAENSILQYLDNAGCNLALE